MSDLRLYIIANHYGLEPQLNVLQEECAELIQSISKYRRDGIKLDSIPSGVLYEIADVEIMLEQIRILFGDLISNEINSIKDEKITRQMARISESEVDDG